MKTKTLLMFMLCITTFSLSIRAQDKKEKNNAKQEVVFDVSMTCQNCKKRIEKNIPFEKGVKDMKVNLPEKTVMIQFNPAKTNVADLQKAFEKLGYQATLHNLESDGNQ